VGGDQKPQLVAIGTHIARCAFTIGIRAGVVEAGAEAHGRGSGTLHTGLTQKLAQRWVSDGD
jgi:hypothetical protein